MKVHQVPIPSAVMERGRNPRYAAIKSRTRSKVRPLGGCHDAEPCFATAVPLAAAVYCRHALLATDATHAITAGPRRSDLRGRCVWPKVPPQWKLGDASSFAVDAQDNVYVLHRPRTLKPEDAAKAAPPVMVFDAAGNFIKAWGGAGSGYEWPEREHGIHIDHKGFVWIGGNQLPDVTASRA